LDSDEREPHQYGSLGIRIQTLCLLFLTKRFCVKIEEEELLRAELRKIEARKKEREKKTADLQKLIAQADSSAAEVSDLCFPSLSLPIVLAYCSSAAEVSDLCFPPPSLPIFRAFCFGARIQLDLPARIQNLCYESGSALSYRYTDKSH
jgi:hypothetical protein